MSLSSNNFAKDQPTKSAGSFVLSQPSSGSTPVSSNPTQSSNSFASSMPSMGATPVSSKPAADNHVFEGDNTGADAYGGDFATFGEIYGQDNFGGLTHFKNRPTLPVVNH